MEYQSPFCAVRYPNTPIPQYPKDGDPKDGRTDGDREDMDAASVLDHMDLSRECEAKAVW